MGLSGQEKLDVEEFASAARLGGTDALLQLPQVREALGKFVAVRVIQESPPESVLRIGDAEFDVRVDNGYSPLSLEHKRRQVESMLLRFLREVLRG